MSEHETGGPAFPFAFNEEDRVSDGMTLRQYAAIKLRVPDSGTDWLDEMIERSVRDAFAAKAMQGWLSSFGDDAKHPASFANGRFVKMFANDAYILAEAMMEESEP